jgi:putative two-component system response regulator
MTQPFDHASRLFVVRNPASSARLRLEARAGELDQVRAAMLTLATAIESRDPYTSGHCDRLAGYGVALGAYLGLPADDLDALRQGGYLHDIGKVAVPDVVLFKPGPLTPDEFDVIKTHTTIGDAICSSLSSLSGVRAIIRSHHERLDGSGYPDGLRGSAVPLLAQIVSVVDVFDALTTDRPYRQAMSWDDALKCLRREAAMGLRDRALVDALAGVIRRLGRPCEPHLLSPARLLRMTQRTRHPAA